MCGIGKKLCSMFFEKMYNTFTEPDFPATEKNFPYDFLPITLPKEYYGYIWLFLSAIFLGLGNSLEPVSILSWLHLYCLIIGIEGLNLVKWNYTFFVICYVIVLHAFGFTIGFSTIFGYPHPTTGTLFQTFAIGLLYWTLIVILALIPHYYLHRRYPSISSTLFVYPICQTAVSIVIIGNVASTFTSIGNSVLDIAPLAQISSLFGLAGIEFYLILSATWAAYLTLGYITIHSKIYSHFILFSITLFTITGFLIYSNTFYQRNVSSQISTPLLSTACIFGQTEKYGTSSYEAVWNNTQQRISDKHNFIFWAEETVEINSDDEEEEIINRGINLTLQSNGISYLGLSYYKHKHHSNKATNHFTLITPTGEIAWNYKKAHPVPGVEDEVEAGPLEIPIHNSIYGKLSGSICFDLDYSNTIKQAGEKNVDIFLQPSWTWNAISTRHFVGNSLRAIENGFTLIRCSSDGESGVVDPKGVFKTRIFTGHNPNTVVVFPVAKEKHLQTMYTAFGFVFEWILLCLLFVCYFFLLAPSKWLSSCSLDSDFDSQPLP
jgi:apolipoprotein N-acyltransferase